MGIFLHRMILVTLVLTITIPNSIGHNEKSDQSDLRPDNDGGYELEIELYLKGICSDLEKPDRCWKIIKPEVARFKDTDSHKVASILFNLAMAKSSELKDKLNQLSQDSEDDELKEKYAQCSRDYDNAKTNLYIAKTHIYSENCWDIPPQIKVALHKLTSCENEFDKPTEVARIRHLKKEWARIRHLNKELRDYVDIVWVATHRFLITGDDEKCIIFQEVKKRNNDRKTISI